jgi:membrane-associated HD superfamily phosphohydrolase
MQIGSGTPANETANSEQQVDQIECTEDELKAAEAMVDPIFEKMKSEYSEDLDELRENLLYNAMVEIKSDSEAGRIKKRCEICNSDHPHPCWLRGPEFQPDWLRKRIEQINLRDGNKPTESPTEKITPPKASFSKQKSLRFNHMSFQQDDSDQDIDALLDSIQSNIDQQVDGGTLSVKPNWHPSNSQLQQILMQRMSIQSEGQ